MKEGKANIVGHIKINSFLISYGASRRMSRSPNFTNNSFNRDKFSSLFDESIELINVEEWYLQKFLAFQTSENGIKKQLKDQLEIIKNILIDFLPDVLDLRIKEVKNINEKSVLEVKINKDENIDYFNEIIKKFIPLICLITISNDDLNTFNEIIDYINDNEYLKSIIEETINTWCNKKNKDTLLTEITLEDQSIARTQFYDKVNDEILNLDYN
jgi:hypothetical protein